MTNIEPTGRAREQGQLNFADPQQVDPATALLVLAFHQSNILRDSLVARVGGTRDQLSELGRIAKSSAAISQLRATVVRQESEATEDVLRELGSLKSKYLAGDQSGLVVTEADNERFRALAGWARERGLSQSDFTIEILLPNEAKSDAAVANTTSNSKTQAKLADSVQGAEKAIVVDDEALIRNLATLQGYLSAVKDSRADNPVLRKLIADSQVYLSLTADAKAAGLSDSLASLPGLARAVVELQREAESIHDQLRSATAALRILTQRAEEKNNELTQVVHTHDRSEQARNERVVSERSEVARKEDWQEFIQTKESEEVSRALQDAIRSLEQAHELLSRPAIHELAAASADVSAKLEAWKADLLRQLDPASVPPPTGRTAPSALRRSYV